ncbi:MAG: pyruvate kinase, partial [Oscillospiraceae bacterium]|nr:pyruvate kinase [Oscillospiraceae bacterium]
MRKTKIVCTIGPATDDDKVLREIMLAGMNVARFNFSHGDYEIHKKRFEQVVRLRDELGIPVATMLDTRGPEIRLGKFIDDKPVEIFDGDTFTLTTEDIPCTAERASITFKGLPADVSVGTRILINDGVIELEAEKITASDIVCKVISGGTLSNNKGVNVPGVDLSMPYLSERDMNDLEFGSKMGYDFIAASFVRSSADINYLKKFTKSLGWSTPRIIAKIENMDGVN